MGAEVELHRLVDLALRSPDAGVVNFNHLHTLLHAILNHIGLSFDPLSGVINAPFASSNEFKDENPSAKQSGQTETERKAFTGHLGGTLEQAIDKVSLSDQQCRLCIFSFVCNKFVKLQWLEYANNRRWYGNIG